MKTQDEPQVGGGAVNSELLRLREQVAALRADLAAAERAKTEYLQNVAHQLAAPINAIKMNIETLTHPRVSINRKQVLLRSIYSQGSILAHLIKNFSLMSHLEGDHSLDSFREDPEETDLFLLCVNLSNDFQPVGKYKDQSIFVDEDQYRQVRYPKLKVIKSLFAQVIYNLLENATKYADPDTRIIIGLRQTRDTIGPTVTSCGVPVGAEDLPRLFDRGYRAEAAKAPHPAGTGFGLYIARRIMEIHGGTLTCEPNGKSTTFVVQSPRKGGIIR